VMMVFRSTARRLVRLVMLAKCGNGECGGGNSCEQRGRKFQAASSRIVE
jgi:hypothetical protein